MKKFIVDTGNKKYNVKAQNYAHAIQLVNVVNKRHDICDARYQLRYRNGNAANMGYIQLIKETKHELVFENMLYSYKNEKYIYVDRLSGIARLKNGDIVGKLEIKDALNDVVIDEASALQTVNALLEDERAAVNAYNVALENLKGKIPDESYAVIEVIRNDENRHIENLQAVVNGTVTEKNLEDSVKDDYFWSEIKPGEHVYIEYRDAGRRLATLPNKTVFKGYEGGMIVVNMNGKELRIPENTITVRTKDSVKDIDVEHAADLADEIASLLRRNKIEQAKRVLQLLIAAMR